MAYFLHSNFLILILIGVLPQYTSAAEILLVFAYRSRSHYIIGEALTLGLAKAGHNVTLVSQFPDNLQLDNVETVQLTGAMEMEAEIRNKFISIDQLYEMSIPLIIFGHGEPAFRRTKYTLNHKNMQELMRTRKFDAVVIEYISSEALLGLGPHFNAPLIMVATMGATKWTTDLVGTPSPLSYVPHILSSFSDKMSFWQRIMNTMITLCEIILTNLIAHPAQREIYNGAFPNATMSYEKALRNVSLVLVNTHFSLLGPRPYVPNMIEVGGLHVDRQIRELPKNLKSFLDSAADGAIYFSFGSVIKGTLMSPAHRETFVRVFAGLKQKVIWKFEGHIPFTENILTGAWLPQNDILAHPNIKVFITHGGLLGLTESVYHGVPVIGCPIIADERRNMQAALRSGYALHLDYKNITDDSLIWALNEVLTNKKYAEAAQVVSRIYRDQPLTPMETAVYWIEYVIRHKGAPHLRSASMDLDFFQYHNIDVFILMLLLIIFSVFIFMKLIKLCCRRLGYKCHAHNDSKITLKKKQ